MLRNFGSRIKSAFKRGDSSSIRYIPFKLHRAVLGPMNIGYALHVVTSNPLRPAKPIRVVRAAVPKRIAIPFARIYVDIDVPTLVNEVLRDSS